MGSYPLQILPADPTAMGQFGAGIGQGLSNVSSVYADAAIKDLFQKKDDTRKASARNEAFKSAIDFIKQNGQVPKYGYGPDGMKVEGEVVDPKKIIPDVIAGVASPKTLPGYEGIKGNIATQLEQDNPGMGDMLDAQENNPDSVGVVTDANGNPTDSDYGGNIKEALLKSYFPGSTQADVQRKVFGLPALKTDSMTIPKDFAADFKQAHDAANSDEAVFVKNLKEMAVKYADNPKAIEQIQKFISMNTSKKGARRAPR